MKYIKKFNETLSGGYLKVPEKIYDEESINNSKEDEYKISKITDALRKNDFSIIDSVINKYGIDYENGLLLRQSAFMDNLKMFKYLLDKGAKLSDRRYIAIRAAAESKSSNIFEYIIKNNLIPKDQVNSIIQWIETSDALYNTHEGKRRVDLLKSSLA